MITNNPKLFIVGRFITNHSRVRGAMSDKEQYEIRLVIREPLISELNAIKSALGMTTNTETIRFLIRHYSTSVLKQEAPTNA